MSHLLAIDSVERGLDIAVLDSEQRLVAYCKESEQRSAESLVFLLNQACCQAQISFEQISEVCLCLGPGSFTGIRSGIASAEGLFAAIACKLSGLSLFLARSVERCAPSALLVPRFSINKDEFAYALIFCSASGKPERISEICLTKKSEFAQSLASSLDKESCVEAQADVFEIDSEHIAQPAYLLAKAKKRFAGLFLSSHYQTSSLSPLYVKPVNALSTKERADMAKRG